VLANGGTLWIDEGKPAPGLFDKSLANLREVSPTLYFNVPRGFDMLAAALEKDAALADRFFSRLRLMFYAAAALPQNLWERFEQLTRARGKDVANPADVLQVGQEIEAQVVKIEIDAKGNRRIGLSLRALAPDPWATVRERFPVGAHVRGVVRRLEPFGAFVELVPGIDGLVHVSRVVLDRRISHPRQVLTIGDEVDVTVVEVDPVKRRIGLSMVERAKQAKDATEAEERRDTETFLAKPDAQTGLGTLGDLLSRSKPNRRTRLSRSSNAEWARLVSTNVPTRKTRLSSPLIA